jgi:hypothetical protein
VIGEIDAQQGGGEREPRDGVLQMLVAEGHLLGSACAFTLE